ncbi:hypothetical protein Tsubulata_027522 [Turnera subulata]|uniref:Uncharacterized protein n=1 Tax=Turnera subulata TaxID=218843 RepID=A0A9Q0G6M0_9ROSI|nr:hypothetical protein Tsubulata_027522 [Turnera subulata]
MRARLVVFPVRGRNWCFGRSIEPCVGGAASGNTPSTLKCLWKKISNSNSGSNNVELVVDFVSNKMNNAWMGLEKAPEGSLKNKIHGLGLKLLAGVKPSEIFLKSISKDITAVDIAYPSSLKARLVRRRLRHIAIRGVAIHKKYFYGSVSLLPLTTAFTVLPLPNVPFFWVLFRAYSHWRALQGSEKLLKLVSDNSYTQNSHEPETDDSKHIIHSTQVSPWVLRPSKELEEFIRRGSEDNGLSEQAFSDICRTFCLNMNDVSKFRNTM